MPRVLTKMRVDEVSGVPRGAGEGVTVKLLKQDEGVTPSSDEGQAKERAKASKKAAKTAAKADKKRAAAEDKAAGHQATVEKSEEVLAAEKLAKQAAKEAKIEAYMKREFTEEQRRTMAHNGQAMKGGGFPIANRSDLKNAVRAIGRAKNPEKTKRHIIGRARAMGMTEHIPDKWVRKSVQKSLLKIAKLAKSEGGEDFYTELAEMSSLDFGEGIIEAVHDSCHALKHSIESIMEDNGTPDKGGAIRESFGQFVDYVSQLSPDSDVAKAISKIHDSYKELEMKKTFTSVGQNDTKSRTAEDKKQGYVDVEENAEGKYADAKGEPDSSAAGKATNKADNPFKEELEKEKETKKMWKSRFHKILAMRPDHREYLFHKANDMSDDDKKDFVDDDDDGRDGKMNKNSIESQIQKAMDNLPEPLRKKLEAAEAAETQLAKMAEEREVTEFTKRATDLRLPNPAEFSKHLVALHKAAPEAFAAFTDQILKQLNALQNQVNMGGLFKELGAHDMTSVNDGHASAYDQLMGKAAELRKLDPKLTEQQAFSKAYTDPANRELVATEKMERNRARM